MRTSRARTGVWTLLLASALPSLAGADPMDLALNRLSYFNDTPWNGNSVNTDPTRWRFQGGCGTSASGALPMGQPFARCFADNQLWANLVNELGGALAPALAAPAMSIGYGGLYVGFEESISNINRHADYWTRGTQGTSASLVGEGTNARRDRADANTFVSRLHVRKGLPYGFELGTAVSYLHSSSIWAIGMDLRWALLEGFRRGVGYLPDIAVRGSVNSVVGQSQLNLTVVGVDLSVSKRFAVSGIVRLTPFLGVQQLFIFGDSGVIDFTPTRSAYRECPRQEIRYVPDPNAMGDPNRLVGQLQCGGGGVPQMPARPGDPPVPGDLNDTHNNGVFERMRIRRTRGFVGLQFQWELISVTGEFALDLGAPGFFSDPSPNAGRPSTQPMSTGNEPIRFDSFTQWTTSIAVGLAFR